MNIRTLTSVCAGLALVSVIVTANLWRELRVERGVTADLQARLDASPGMTSPTPAAPIDAGTASVAQVVTTAQPEKAAAPPEPAARPNTATAAQISALAQEELQKDPEYRKAMAAMQRSSMDQGYFGLAEEVGLGKEEAERFLDLLSEHQMAQSSQIRPLTPDMQQDRAAMDEMMRQRQALQRQQELEIRNMLGDAKYAKWQEFQPTRGARMQAGMHASQLAIAGLPLDNTQLKSFTAAMIAEQKNMQQDLRSITAAGPPPDRQSMQEAFQKRREDSNRRLLEAAKPVLTSQQLNALRERLEQQEAMARASNRVRDVNGAGGTIVVF